MKTTVLSFGQYTMKTYLCNTAVVGTGAAGYNAADRLYTQGQQDIAIVTEHRLAGTSRNTGSDKQTYYKLTLGGGDGDSVLEMAKTLFEGECVDGDIALCEAALSAQSFLKLCELGMPFPRNRYGEFVGYKTDHDPRRRATSIGPYTSKKMTEVLEAAVQAKGIAVLDRLQVVRVLTQGGAVKGLLCLNLAAPEGADRFVLLCCKNVVFATGGPAGMYADSVFPNGHYGASGLAFEAGVVGKNLTEWQYGLASVRPRWNVSGTYMQVMPRFISVDADGAEREFLLDFFENENELLEKVFLKGYQWPFDVRKIDGGSSIVDVLVYLEQCAGRRVYLDFRANPNERDINFAALTPEVREYLEKAGACFGTPIERLLKMNAPAVSFYLDKGVDLQTERLEIALCAQHNNGGLGIDCWWQTNVQGFFAVGEVAASHGVYRPGGSALNAGQVGSTRAAQYIAARCTGEVLDAAALETPEIHAQISDCIALGDAVLTAQGEQTVDSYWAQYTRSMSQYGAAIREESALKAQLARVQEMIAAFASLVKTQNPKQLGKAYRLKEMLVSQSVYLSAMLDYIQNGGKSRGSALYSDANGKKPYASLPDAFTFVLDDGTRGTLVQEIALEGAQCTASWRKIRPIPTEDDFFEVVWSAYREDGNIH